MTRNLIRYLRKQGIPELRAEAAQSVLLEWRARKIPLWEASYKRDDERLAMIVGQALTGKEIKFFSPVCPDYPAESSNGELGTGVSATGAPTLSLLRQISELLEENSVPYSFQILLADTEVDMPEIVALLADSVDDFRQRCRESLVSISQSAPELFSSNGAGRHHLATFCDFFGDNWFTAQYYWESVTREKLQQERSFNTFLQSLAFTRREKYEKQLGKRLERERWLDMAVRHYAQYHAIGYWLRQFDEAVFVNSNSPNLRAIRQPFIVSPEQCSFFANTTNQSLRIPIVVV